MFASRVPATFESGPWARRLACLKLERRPLIDLSDHNPTTAQLGYLDAATAQLLAAVQDPAFRTYAPEARGSAEARAAIARYYEDAGAAVSPDHVVLTASTSESYAHVFRLLCEPGDGVLVPRPSYPLFDPLATAEGVRALPYALTATGRLEGDAIESTLRRAAESGIRVRALLLVHPNHPTGSFHSIAEAASVRRACARAGLALVVDEVFIDYPGTAAGVTNGRAGTFANGTAGADTPLTLVLSGLSKVCGLPQLKLGWIVVAGPKSLTEPALARLEWLADLFLSVNGPVQHALPALLAGRHAFQEAVRARVAENRAALLGALREVPGAVLLPEGGGWSAIVALPAVRTDEEWALALLEHDVIVHPGYFYDFEEPARVVVSLLPPPSMFAEALARMVEVAR